jgi:hypothetical protein
MEVLTWDHSYRAINWILVFYNHIELPEVPITTSIEPVAHGLQDVPYLCRCSLLNTLQDHFISEDLDPPLI